MNAITERVSRGKKFIALLAVFALTYLSPYVMQLLGLNVLKGMVYSPLFVLPSCIVYFLLERFVREPSRTKESARIFAKALVLWALAGAGVALVGVVVVTAIMNSTQGPLAFMFYGPAGLAVGGIAGTVLWRISIVKPNFPVQSGPAASGRPLT